MYIDSWLHIGKKELTLDQKKYLKNILSITEFDFNSKRKKIELFKELGSELLIPRNTINRPEIIDNSDLGKDISLESKIKYRNEYQKEAVDFIINNNCGFIKCAPGFGKTVVAIKAICDIGKKALIFVDQIALAEQWIERFIQHSSCKECDIGILDKKLNLDYPIVITTVQSVLAKIRKDAENFEKIMKDAKFGMTFFDEVHCIIGPEAFTSACAYCFSRRLIGLSATPYKNLNREMIIKSWLSKKMYVHDVHEIKPTIKLVKFESKLKDNYKKYVYWGGRFDKRKYYKQIIKRTSYLDMVCSIIKQAYDKQRKLLILSGLKNDFLKTMNKILIEKYNVSEEDISVFISGVGREALSKQIILSNFSMCYKGIDESSLDTLIFLSSIVSPTYLEQSIGRILRIHPTKKDPVVVDFLDYSHQSLVNEWNMRKEFYELNDFNILGL